MSGNGLIVQIALPKCPPGTHTYKELSGEHQQTLLPSSLLPFVVKQRF